MTVLACLAFAPAASAHGTHAADEPLLGESTLDHTVLGDDQQSVDDGSPGDEFTFLRLGEGERYAVREELARARNGRERRRSSLIYLSQLTDFQLADEESPARVEFIDPTGGPVSSAWRPQEALLPYQVELSIQQVNRFTRSPVEQGDGRRARMANSVLTGDLADNMQANETRWVIELLEGGTFVNGERVSGTIDPNSGSTDDAAYAAGQGCPGAGGVRDALKAGAAGYDGVQDYDDYPASALPGAYNENFWDPDQPAGQYSAWPSYPGLMDRAQQPFEATGLKVPSYVAFGNHDALVQGNQWASQGFDEIARGCVKVFPAPGAEAFLEELLGGSLNRRVGRDGDTIGAALDLAIPSAALEDFQMLVPPDPGRRLVDRPSFKQLHDTGFQEDDHGFAYVDASELQASNGAASYYDFSPDRGMRYVVLDTVSHGGQFPDSSSGNVDHPQFVWLREVLRRAERRDELVLVFAHHAIGSLTSNVPDEAAPPCTTPSPGPGCDIDPRDSRAPGSPAPHQGDDLEALLLEHPNVITLVAGHSHENRVAPVEGGRGEGDFWEIKTPAIVDWPPQHRLIEVMDNNDGTLSIFGTLLDDGSAARAPGGGAAVGGLTPAQLSSLGRTLAYNDPQVGPGDGTGKGPQGEAIDRNVELLIADPRQASSRGSAGTRRCAGKPATIRGTGKAAVLRGTKGRDVIAAGGGADRIRGRGGRDLICAGGGKDRVNAGGGADLVRGGKGADRIRGGAGSDVLRGNRGRDRLFGGGGRDLLRGGPGKDKVRGGPGRDDVRD